MLDPPFVQDERATLQEPHPPGLEGGKVERLRECEVFIREEGKRQMESGSRFTLVVTRLRGQSKQMGNATSF